MYGDGVSYSAIVFACCGQLQVCITSAIGSELYEIDYSESDENQLITFRMKNR